MIRPVTVAGGGRNPKKSPSGGCRWVGSICGAKPIAKFPRKCRSAGLQSAGRQDVCAAFSSCGLLRTARQITRKKRSCLRSFLGHRFSPTIADTKVSGHQRSSVSPKYHDYACRQTRSLRDVFLPMDAHPGMTNSPAPPAMTAKLVAAQASCPAWAG
ncbi:MAG: hypothetical protein ONB49_20865, partial [candidate division KSB1 bacterium]|nr:hypothetical protein [candidate division KSB1 bacterium]